MKCANCTNPAHYVYKITDATVIAYCDAHLPRFLFDRKKAGLLETTDDFEKSLKEAIKTLGPKTGAANVSTDDTNEADPVDD